MLTLLSVLSSAMLCLGFLSWAWKNMDVRLVLLVMSITMIVGPGLMRWAWKQ